VHGCAVSNQKGTGGMSASMVYVAGDGGGCIGFVIGRGKAGYEAFDAGEKSLGLFSTQAAAAKAVFQREDLHDAGICKQA
jgi:hypothetical protein